MNAYRPKVIKMVGGGAVAKLKRALSRGSCKFFFTNHEAGIQLKTQLFSCAGLHHPPT